MTLSQHGSVLLNPAPPPPPSVSTSYPDTHGHGSNFFIASGDANRPLKRQRVAYNDFVGRGELDEQEARLCFDSYLITLNTPPSPDIPEIQLDFWSIRERSPLCFAVLVTVGARAISHTSSYLVSLAEATRLANETLMAPAKRPSAALDAKALVLLGLYTCMTGFCGHVAEMTNNLYLSSALFRLRDLGQADSRSKEAMDLTMKGRTFLITWIWTTLYGPCRWASPVFQQSSRVMLEQTQILRDSYYSEPALDALLQVHIESALLAHEAYLDLHPSLRVTPATSRECLEVVNALIDRLAAWCCRRKDLLGEAAFLPSALDR